MRALAVGFATVLVVSAASAQLSNPEPADCSTLFPLTAVGMCNESDTLVPGGTPPGGVSTFTGLSPAEINAIVSAAATATNRTDFTIAVVDRAGRPLAVFREANAPSTNDDRAVGTARTAAFFSHNQAPLSSRTVRFIGQRHFPMGVENTASAALYGIENTNRGCDFNARWNRDPDPNKDKCFPRARNLKDLPCNAFDQRGCSQEPSNGVNRPLGIFTGKIVPDDPDFLSINPGGIPLYRLRDPLNVLKIGKILPLNGGPVADLVGAVGVYADGLDHDPEAEIAEFAAVKGAFGALLAGAGAIVPVPFLPLPEPGNVFIDGIKLPFLGRDVALHYTEPGSMPLNGLPDGPMAVDELVGLVQPGTASNFTNGKFIIQARNGGCAPNGYLVGPNAGSKLSQADVDAIIKRGDATAKRTRAAIRLPLNRYARMVMAVADLDGTLLAVYRMPDATIFSIDVAVAKARNVIRFSTSNDLPGVPAGTAVSARSIAFGSQPFFPSGISGGQFKPAPGPFYVPIFVHDLQFACSQGLEPAQQNQSGIVFFAGSTPLYRNGVLIGGFGVSGDGIEQDDYVTFKGAGDLIPPKKMWADNIKIDNVRLPMYKFPRQPEGVTECNGGPCS